jgi:hypothetical protein
MPALAAVAVVGSGVRARIGPRALRFASAGLMLLIGLAALYRALLPLVAGGEVPRCCH